MTILISTLFQKGCCHLDLTYHREHFNNSKALYTLDILAHNIAIKRLFFCVNIREVQKREHCGHENIVKLLVEMVTSYLSLENLLGTC